MKWDDISVFVALTDSGSIKGAAKALGVDHSTVSRRLASLEESLEVKLFQRSSQGLQITEAGRSLLPKARQIAGLVSDFTESATTTADEQKKTVNITVAPVIASYFLMPRLPALQERFPDIELRVHAGIERRSVSRHEADIAIRAHPSSSAPGDADDIALRVAAFELAAFAGKPYVESRGAPERPIRGLEGHQMVIASENGEGAKWNRSLNPPATVALIAYPFASTIAAVESGVGIAVLPCIMAPAHPQLVRVSDTVVSWNLWVVTNEEARKRARLREFKAALVDLLQNEFQASCG